MKFTDQESALLREIQRDASLPLTELAARTGMAQSTVWRKLQEFEATGLLTRRVALLDPAKADASLCVFAMISLADHSQESVDAFASILRSHPEIQEGYAIAGTSDYIVKIRVADVSAYETFLSHTLLRSPHIRNVVSSFALKELKYTTELPV